MWDKNREEDFLDKEKENRRIKLLIKKQKDKKRRKWNDEDDTYGKDT